MEITDITRESDDAVQEMVVTMTASADEVNTYIEQQFKELAKNEIPGFRKGKAPREVIEREAGGHDIVFARIAEAIVNGEAPAMLDDADVLFIGDPQFNLEKIPTENQPFTFTVSGPVPPEGTLSSYDEVAIEMPPNEATEEEIEAGTFVAEETDGQEHVYGISAERLYGLLNQGVDTRDLYIACTSYTQNTEYALKMIAWLGEQTQEEPPAWLEELEPIMDEETAQSLPEIG